VTANKRAKLKGKREEKRKFIRAKQEKTRKEAVRQAKMQLVAARVIDDIDLVKNLGFFGKIAVQIFQHCMETQATRTLRTVGLPKDDAPNAPETDEWWTENVKGVE
jgi:hypothetical protein